MNTTDIREKLVRYMRVADEKKVKATYTMVEDELETAVNEWDETFIKELQLRNKNFANGTAKTYSWKETKEAAVHRLKSVK